MGHIPFVSRLLKKILVNALIWRKRPLPIRHRRRVELRDEEIVIDDEIDSRVAVSGLSLWSYFTAIHMGSAAYHDGRVLRDSTKSKAFPDKRSYRIRSRLGLQGMQTEEL